MLKKIRFDFVKYQGCGNDFILMDERYGIRIQDEKKPGLVMKLCDRHFGIGADGMLFVEPSSGADAKMRLFNREGSEAFMCGNGIRCVVDYLHNELKKDKLLIDTNDGLKEVVRVGHNQYRVNMGRLRYVMKDIKDLFKGDFQDDEQILDKEMTFPNLGKIRVSIVNSSEPHAVIFLEDIEKKDINRYGKSVTENLELFPYEINTNLCQVIDDETIKVRTYESGVYYETLACGTGVTACAGVAYLTSRLKTNKIKVITRGGKMTIEIGKYNLFMTGPAHPVFKGEIYIEI